MKINITLDVKDDGFRDVVVKMPEVEGQTIHVHIPEAMFGPAPAKAEGEVVARNANYSLSEPQPDPAPAKQEAPPMSEPTPDIVQEIRALTLKDAPEVLYWKLAQAAAEIARLRQWQKEMTYTAAQQAKSIAERDAKLARLREECRAWREFADDHAGTVAQRVAVARLHVDAAAALEPSHD